MNRIPFTNKHYLLEQRWKLDATTVSGICDWSDRMYDLNKHIIYPPAADHRRGNRTHEQYTYDIIDGWTTEYFLLAWFKNKGIEVELDGCDKERTILTARITTEPDFITPVGFKFEVISSHLILKDNIYHIKKPKLDRLIQKGNGTIMLVNYKLNAYYIAEPHSIDTNVVVNPKGLDYKDCYIIRPPKWSPMK